RAKTGVARRRRLRDRVDGLSGAIVARSRHPLLEFRPELRDRALVADDHACTSACRDAGETAAVRPGGDDVGADVAERGEPAVVRERREAAEPAPGDVLEEDP